MRCGVAVASLVLVVCGGVAAAHGEEGYDIRAKLQVTSPGHVHLLTLKDGSLVAGRIWELKDHVVLVESGEGVEEISLEEVESVDIVTREELAERRQGAHSQRAPREPAAVDNPHRSHMLFTQTGRMMKQGEGYLYASAPVILPLVVGLDYGVTDFLSVSAGLIPPYWMHHTPAYSRVKLGTHLAKYLDVAGSIYLWFSQSEAALFAQETLSIGPPSGHLTLGVLQRLAPYGRVISALTVGFELPIVRGASLLGEALLSPADEEIPFVIGFRAAGQGLCFEFSVTTFENDSKIPVLPITSLYLDF